MRTASTLALVLLWLFGSLAAEPGRRLNVEEARRLVAARLGADALPGGNARVEYRVEESGNEAVLVSELLRRGPSFRFVRRGGVWVLAGLDLPVEDAPGAGGAVGEAGAVRIELEQAGVRVDGMFQARGIADVGPSVERALADGRGGRAVLDVGGRSGDDPEVVALVEILHRAGARSVTVLFSGERAPRDRVPVVAPSPSNPTGPPPATEPAPSPPPGNIPWAPEPPAAPTQTEEPLETTGDAAADTRASFDRLAGALGRYRRTEGGYPPAVGGATVDELEARGDFLYPFYLRKVPRTDGWGRPIRYEAGQSGNRYELRSAGPDGKPGNADDVVMVNGRLIAGEGE